MPDVTMPRLSDSMEEATIVNWLVTDGDEVTVGQELAEVETDKATVSFEAEAAGRIEVLAHAGETVALGAVIARILNGDEPKAASPSDPDPVQQPLEPTEGPQATAATITAGRATPSERRRMRALASPLARRIAASHDIDLGTLVGTGPRGRVVKADLAELLQPTTTARPHPQPVTEAETQAAAPAQREPAGPAGANGSDPAAGTSHQTVELSRTQELIARRMSQSRATIPDFDASIEVDMEAAWALRARLKSERADPVPSLNDIIVMACGRALAEYPKVNAAYKGGQIQHYDHVNVGIAIATEDSLLVATVSDTDRRSLGDIARTSRQLAAEVRDGSITPAELSGATFTVSNLGMFAVDSFTAVLNAPQAGILAVGAVRERAVAREGQVVCRRTAILTLAVDHRLVYGADAARFLSRVQALLEAPLNLLAG